MPTIKVDLNETEVRAVGEYAKKEDISFYKAVRVLLHTALDLPLKEKGGSRQSESV